MLVDEYLGDYTTQYIGHYNNPIGKFLQTMNGGFHKGKYWLWNIVNGIQRLMMEINYGTNMEYSGEE